tara:strand:- start:6297 stop:6533 length:237 start_codon:yes stop_codon:yes gene_type:complete
MGYQFKVIDGCRVKEDKEYPWPCASDPNRTIELFDDDVLTKDLENGTYMKHTGIGCFNIVIPDEDIEQIEGDTDLQMI